MATGMFALRPHSEACQPFLPVPILQALETWFTQLVMDEWINGQWLWINGFWWMPSCSYS